MNRYHFQQVKQSAWVVTGILLCLTLSSCGLFGGAADEATPIASRIPVPTFTATPVGNPPEAAQPVQALPAQPTPTQPAAPAAQQPAVEAPTNTPAPPSPTDTVAVAPTNTPAPVKPQIIVKEPLINVRNGPDTTYGLVGSINQNERYDIVGKTATGDWWKICCINGAQGWVFGQLVTAENTASVPVDTSVQPPPVAQQPTQAPAAPAQPAPAPAQPTPVPAPPANDPCAGIGGDGCKFKIKSGPSFAANSGELKLQLYFIHSGIEGGQPQGSYFVAMFKDGQKLLIPDSLRSISLEKNQGTLGLYNYEYSVQLGQIPGGSLAGSYSIYVLDGNGERDSKDFAVNVPDGQGLVYIVFDQG